MFSFPFVLFFCNDTATTEIYTLSLHDALPISAPNSRGEGVDRDAGDRVLTGRVDVRQNDVIGTCQRRTEGIHQRRRSRSEEHTSELQSQSNLVCRLLLEKKKRTRYM